jgi:hypothetical protein
VWILPEQTTRKSHPRRLIGSLPPIVLWHVPLQTLPVKVGRA